MWSDTGSFNLESKGDVLKLVNLDAANFSGPVPTKTLRTKSQENANDTLGHRGEALWRKQASI